MWWLCPSYVEVYGWWLGVRGKWWTVGPTMSHSSNSWVYQIPCATPSEIHMTGPGCSLTTGRWCQPALVQRDRQQRACRVAVGDAVPGCVRRKPGMGNFMLFIEFIPDRKVSDKDHSSWFIIMHHDSHDFPFLSCKNHCILFYAYCFCLRVAIRSI